MTIYIILLIYILLLSVFSAHVIPDDRKRERFILRLGMLAVFLLLALKKETVGTDIPGYKLQYLLSAAVPWRDVGYVYFEPGYIQIMKLFSKLGLAFQVFAAAIYGICCGAYYKFMERYSPNVTLSLLIFICYQFFVFYTSGLRQALAMAICIYAFMLVDGERGARWKRIAGAMLLVLLATTVHKSALLFFAVILMALWGVNRVHWVFFTIILGVSGFIRPLLLRFINYFIGEVNLSSGITLGGNFLFLLGLALFCVLGYYQHLRFANGKDNRFLSVSTNILMMAVIAQVLFSGSSLLRSAMYLTMFLIPGLPCALKCFERKIEILATWFLGLFLICLFWTDTLSVNQLNLYPYLFFWQS